MKNLILQTLQESRDALENLMTNEETIGLIEEAAKLLRISRPLAYRLVKNGQIPSVRLGHRHIISRLELMRFIEKGGLTASG